MADIATLAAFLHEKRFLSPLLSQLFFHVIRDICIKITKGQQIITFTRLWAVYACVMMKKAMSIRSPELQRHRSLFTKVDSESAEAVFRYRTPPRPRSEQRASCRSRDLWQRIPSVHNLHCLLFGGNICHRISGLTISDFQVQSFWQAAN